MGGLVLSDDELRNDFAAAIADALPITESGADDVESALRGVSANAGAVGLVSLVTLLWTASGMMGAIRGGLDDMDPDTPPRPYARGKLVDLAMLLLTMTFLVGAAGLTVASRLGGSEGGDAVGLPGALYELVRIVVPVALGAVLLAAVLRWVPNAGRPMRETLPACAVGSFALWALSTGFAAFVGRFGRYNLVYGSLATVVVFLVFVYLAANILLLTAAFATEWRGVRRDRPGSEPGPGLGVEIVRFLRSLVMSDDRGRGGRS